MVLTLSRAGGCTPCGWSCRGCIVGYGWYLLWTGRVVLTLSRAGWLHTMWMILPGMYSRAWVVLTLSRAGGCAPCGWSCRGCIAGRGWYLLWAGRVVLTLSRAGGCAPCGWSCRGCIAGRGWYLLWAGWVVLTLSRVGGCAPCGWSCRGCIAGRGWYLLWAGRVVLTLSRAGSCAPRGWSCRGCRAGVGGTYSEPGGWLRTTWMILPGM